MPANTVSLWPAVIRAAVQSPESILIGQAEALTEQTSGVLVGQVASGVAEENLEQLNFSILVPDLNNYRHRIMVVQHKKDMHYPAWIDAEVFRANGLAGLMNSLRDALNMSSPFSFGETGGNKPSNRADSDKEFIELVGKVLESQYVIAVAQSLIARVNDVKAGKRLVPLAPLSGSPPQTSETASGSPSDDV